MFKSRGAEKFSRLLREFYFECGIDTFFFTGGKTRFPKKKTSFRCCFFVKALSYAKLFFTLSGKL